MLLVLIVLQLQGLENRPLVATSWSDVPSSVETKLDGAVHKLVI